MIKINSLHKFFNKGRQNEIHVINDINLQLPEKGMVAIFGKSGCGKTTLLNVIGGLDKFHSGIIDVNGNDISRNADMVRNQSMGYIFQNYNLCKEETCFQNVANALMLCGVEDPSVIEERVMAALENVGMEKYSKRTPDTLSGGQQQRIAIARAIVKNPGIILADEPTGNLDEANTVMIMDLLKEISNEHLVLLVTHEANLVDYYCDTVIELSDGKVVNIKNNESASGFYQKDKNAIYLGEFEKTSLNHENVNIEYYGESSKAPINLKIINNGGKFYVKIDSSNVQVLEDSSEIKLKEGVYKQKYEEAEKNLKLQMSKLPPISGTRFGTLFAFKNSVKSGYAVFSQKQKRGKKMMRRCMCLFAAVFVFMCAGFGISVSDILDAKDSYNHNVFYVYTDDNAVSEKLNNAVKNEESGIDYIRISHEYPSGDKSISFEPGQFETFSQNYFSSTISANAVYLGTELVKDLPLVAGKKDDISQYDIIITTDLADKLIEKSTLGYISEYNDLLGLTSSDFTVGGENIRIVGVVKSSESAVYLSERSMAQYVINQSGLKVVLASEYGIEVSEGSGVIVTRYEKSTDLPQKNSTVKINGRDIKIENVITAKEYLLILDYKRLYGETPTEKVLEELVNDPNKYAINFQEEDIYGVFNYDISYLVSETDFVAFSKQIGETDESALGSSGYIYDSTFIYDAFYSDSYYSDVTYTVVHSYDVALTESWLKSEFSDLKTKYELPAVVTPDNIFQNTIADTKEIIISNLTSMAVVLILLSLCMYFIMRSSLMSRVKEVGIYRAIGVSKRNMTFKFFIEALVVSSLTVLPGYLLSSGFIGACLAVSSLVEEMLFYPIWYAGIVLIILYALSVVCGIIPIILLLRKTPSEILAKYDI